MTSLLFIHGILGSPKHFRFLLPFVPDDVTVNNLQLKGHGGSVREFSHASMAEWKQQVDDALTEMRRTSDHIIIVAHSMGTLFALQEAVTRPVDALFLLNVPLQVRLSPRLFRDVWHLYRGELHHESHMHIAHRDPWISAARHVYGLSWDPNLLHYLGWIPRYMELFSEINHTRHVVGALSTPCMAYLSLWDEMVSTTSGKLLQHNPCVTLQHLHTSGHYYYSKADVQHMQQDFCHMLQQVTA
jgi:esterase/lipase